MVWVASHDLEPGLAIAEADLAGIAVPASALPDGVFLTPGPLLGRVPHERILAGEPVRAERLADPSRGGLAALLPAGMRAVAVEVWLSEEATPFYGPGEELLLHPGSSSEGLVLVLQGPERLPGHDGEAPAPHEVVVLVTPTQAERVHAAHAHGEEIALMGGSFHCFDAWPWFDDETLALLEHLRPPVPAPR